MNAKPLDQCTVLVTAGASGIGHAIASAFHAAGSRVWVCDIDADALDRAVAGLPGRMAATTDVSDPEAVDQLLATIRADGHGLDVLVNNAGIAGPTAAVEDIRTEDWRATLAVDMDGAFFCAIRNHRSLNTGVLVIILLLMVSMRMGW